jgi:hypothetical protein
MAGKSVAAIRDQRARRRNVVVAKDRVERAHARADAHVRYFCCSSGS